MILGVASHTSALFSAVAQRLFAPFDASHTCMSMSSIYLTHAPSHLLLSFDSERLTETMSFRVLICLILFISLISANVEKTIFLGPEPINVPQHSPSLLNLNIDVLTPEDWSLRSHIDTIFPTDQFPRGKETWLVLDDLTEGQRYEVRVCWLATVRLFSFLCIAQYRHSVIIAILHELPIQQPTAFHLETFTLPHVFETPELIASLYNYSMSRQSFSNPIKQQHHSATERESPILFLRIYAAAEYFALNSTLMNHPEPVLTDLILDPFLFNVLPRTLVPTVGFVLLIAAVSWLLGAKFLRPWLTALVVSDGEELGCESEKKVQ